MKEYIVKQTKDELITVRDIQKVILEIVKDISKLCEEHHIAYWINGGSLLGAYRHKGFIPWDDDFDMAMMYDEYLRFIDVLEKYLDKEKYTFHCFEKDNRYNVLLPAMKIRKKGTYIEEVNTLLKNKIDDCDGLFIDVFVYDYCNGNKIIDFFPRVSNKILMPLIVFFENINTNPLSLKKLFLKTARNYGKRNNKSDYIGLDLCWTFKTITKPDIFHKDIIFPLKKIEFEGIKLNCPNNTEQYLALEIGENFRELPPENKRFAKHTKDVRL